MNVVLSRAKELNLHPSFISFLDEVLLAPRGARVEPHSGCNARCVHCPRDQMTRYQGPMSREIFLKSIDGLAEFKNPSVYYLFHHLNGESLLLDIDELVWRINYSKEKLIADLYMFTNASLMTPEVTDKLLASALKWVCFSVDGGNKEDYEKIRRGLVWETVVANITYFCRANKKLPTPKKTQSILLAQKLNQGSIDQYSALFREIGVGDVGGSGIQNIGGMIDGDALKGPGQYRGGYKHTPCWRAFQEINIMADGRVCACCQDVDGRIILGDVNKETPMQIWRSDIYDRFRLAHLERPYVKTMPDEFAFCRDCDVMEGVILSENWWPFLVKSQ